MPIITSPLSDPAWLTKLGAILVQQDDDAEGTIVASALAARRFLRASGLRWRDVIPVLLPTDTASTRAPGPTDWRDKVRECLARANLLSERERNFLESAQSFPRLSPRQLSWLDAIAARVRGA